MIAASIEHKNQDDQDKTIQAYAKIAGKDWTFYVTRTSVNIGRPPDGSTKKSTEIGTPSSPAYDTSDSFEVHIDLGPEKHVSRLHAKLFYNNETSKWVLQVNGRNGVKINGILKKKGEQANLTSGAVMDIAGTEMMFIDASNEPQIDAQYLERLNEAVEEDLEHPVQQTPSATFPLARPDLSYYQAQYALPPTQTFSYASSAVAQPPYGVTSQLTPKHSPSREPFYTQPSSNAQAPPREMMMQSSGPIDYASDAARDIRPTCSYHNLIANAILSSPDECLTLDNIYNWIRSNFAWFRYNGNAWKNSVRHNLSLCTDFEKIPRGTDEPGKGMKWQIIEDRRGELRKLGMKYNGRGGGRKGSGPSSPIVKTSPPRKSPNKTSPNSPSKKRSKTPEQSGSAYPISYGQRVFKSSPTAQTPPLSVYPSAAPESYTPTRGSRISALSHATLHPHPVLSDDASPLPSRPRYLATTVTATDSPPSLSSGNIYFDEQSHGNNLYTPAPQRHEPKLYIPSTAKLPSSFLPMSSPAPFWNKSHQYGSTPAKFFADSSPLKGGSRLQNPSALESSSPPPEVAHGSPTRSRGTPSAIASGGQAKPASQTTNKTQGLGISNGITTEEDDDDDAPIDILRYRASYPFSLLFH